MSSGQDFIKKIGPFGAGLFLVLFVLFLVIAFTSGKDIPLKNYEPPYDSVYYSKSADTMLELNKELQENIFTQLDGEVTSELENGKIRITIDDSHFFKIRSAILNHFDDYLFTFERTK